MTTLTPQNHPAVPAPARRRGLGWGAAVAVALLLSPWASWLARWVPPCPLKTLTGVPCPTCGLTRAAMLLAHGEPFEAFVHHPVPTLIWVAFLAGGLWAGVAALAGRPLRWRMPSRATIVAGAVVLLASWAYNIATGV